MKLICSTCFTWILVKAMFRIIFWLNVVGHLTIRWTPPPFLPFYPGKLHSIFEAGSQLYILATFSIEMLYPKMTPSDTNQYYNWIFPTKHKQLHKPLQVTYVLNGYTEDTVTQKWVTKHLAKAVYFLTDRWAILHREISGFSAPWYPFPSGLWSNASLGARGPKWGGGGNTTSLTHVIYLCCYVFHIQRGSSLTMVAEMLI